MSLTQDDLKKIEAVVNARAELTETRVASKADLEALEHRLNEKIDRRTAMLQEDIYALGRDIADLKKLKPRVRKLEQQTA